MTWCSQVKKMETGGSIMMRDKGTLFMGDVECTLLLANDSSVIATEGQVVVVVVVGGCGGGDGGANLFSGRRDHWSR